MQPRALLSPLRETRVLFPVGKIQLEGLYGEGIGDRAAILTHPHPLYGGDMENPVVATLAQAYAERGYTTLRFNFRGTGASQGTHDKGRGEQGDLAAAAAFLAEREKRVTDLAGYSFGAWINAMALPSLETVLCAVMVAPPVAVLDYAAVAGDPRVGLVVTGSRDDIAPEETLRLLVPRWNPRAHFQVLGGVDHFYGGALDRLEEILSKFLDSRS